MAALLLRPIIHYTANSVERQAIFSDGRLQEAMGETDVRADHLANYAILPGDPGTCDPLGLSHP